MRDEFCQLPPDELPGASPRPAAPRFAPPAENGIDIPHDQIAPDTLDQLIQAFVLREGTDYGTSEVALEKKVEDVRRQLEAGEVKVVFDQATETCSIVPV